MLFKLLGVAAVAAVVSIYCADIALQHTKKAILLMQNSLVSKDQEDE